jgi:hypothetical protein
MDVDAALERRSIELGMTSTFSVARDGMHSRDFRLEAPLYHFSAEKA